MADNRVDFPRIRANAVTKSSRRGSPGKRQLPFTKGETRNMWRKLLLLALAGALGTLARYSVSGWVQRGTGAAFPWGTLAVNTAGCFLAGLAWTLAEHRIQVTGETRAIVLIGFMGAFTTFSAFMLETSELMRDAEWLRAAANVVVMNCAGLAALFAGLFAGRAW